MLQSLFIRNFVLIDELHIRFDEGFSVVTGETGAGKSIILGALGLVLGQRADSKSIQSGADKCVVEAVFDVSAYQLEDFFLSHDLEYDAKNCILRRELMSSGKSRAFINDTPAPLSVVKALGDRLIDVHSQHQNLLLADTQFQMNVVDIMAKTESLLVAYRREYDRYQSVVRQLEELEALAAKSRQDEDYLRFQVEELRAAQLTAGEQEELEAELETLSHTEEIKSALYKVTDNLIGEERGVVQQLKEALHDVEALEAYFPKAKDFADRLRSAWTDMADLASETDVLKEDVEFDPNRLEWVNERLNTIYSLQQKHRVPSVEELLAIQQQLTTQLSAIDLFDEQMETLTKQRETIYEALMVQAGALTARRHEAATEIEQQLVDRMVLLGIPNTRFRIELWPKEKPSADGMDEVCFLFSANKNEALKPVAQTASGGEISRLMLCIKAMIAGFAALPAIIFDEIDTGISGEIADKMADIMQDLGQKMQVITITHLPQIAAKGRAHYFVYKEDTAERTLTRIRLLTTGERVNEVARMLSGASLTDAAVANAKALLQKEK
ncbi:DNA repair protein RecN [Tannerella forsythia 92A2]|uniref:DNA repair protein RecN n=1 Tax=Tannerella forsythia (strain ATCC 43037 / JCM 10827 / CCUG 21028 A / KCTC 5666 / FDC 338) TaxID=203275 RepID=G8UKU5_TANFA|nr:DNA repair protein RecN [Tannerella forsythia]AEW22518.1 DNA repair protein RecN [Tannerella forsythia 92A2]